MLPLTTGRFSMAGTGEKFAIKRMQKLVFLVMTLVFLRKPNVHPRLELNLTLMIKREYADDMPL